MLGESVRYDTVTPGPISALTTVTKRAFLAILQASMMKCTCENLTRWTGRAIATRVIKRFVQKAVGAWLAVAMGLGSGQRHEIAGVVSQ